jgi:hypothetical protein
MKNNTSTKSKSETDLKCCFCGIAKEESFVMVQGITNNNICDKCIRRAYKLYKNEADKNEEEKDTPILKTARVMAGNREVIVNKFEHQYTVTVRRYCQTASDDGIFETIQTINLTEPSFCLLISALNKVAKQFDIDVEAIINQLETAHKVESY